MRKFLSIVALLMVVAMTSVAFGQTRAVTSLRELAKTINTEAAAKGETDYIASVRGNDLVLTGEMDESDLNGLTVGMMVNMINGGGDDMIKLMLADLMEEMDETDHMMVDFMHKNKSNLILHFIGKQSRQEGEIVIRHDLLPE